MTFRGRLETVFRSQRRVYSGRSSSVLLSPPVRPLALQLSPCERFRSVICGSAMHRGLLKEPLPHRRISRRKAFAERLGRTTRVEEIVEGALYAGEGLRVNRCARFCDKEAKNVLVATPHLVRAVGSGTIQLVRDVVKVEESKHLVTKLPQGLRKDVVRIRHLDIVCEEGKMQLVVNLSQTIKGWWSICYFAGRARNMAGGSEAAANDKQSLL